MRDSESRSRSAQAEILVEEKINKEGKKKTNVEERQKGGRMAELEQERRQESRDQR
jgi:hypothetical protein